MGQSRSRYRRAACQVLVPVGRLPIVRGLEFRALQKPDSAEIGLGQVGAIDYGLEKIGALEASAHKIGAGEIGAAEICVPEVGAGKIGPFEDQAAQGSL